MEIGKIIALNLKRLRDERNLSLGQLAELAGVSKVMLSQLEKGTSNPTINTIWKITGALHLPYTSLLELPESEVVHVKKKTFTIWKRISIIYSAIMRKNQTDHLNCIKLKWMQDACMNLSVIRQTALSTLW